MTTPTGNTAVVDPDRFGDPTPELVASRRQALAFLGAFGLVVPTASLIAAIDSSISKANAQAAPGQPVPRLAVYTPNWPDMGSVRPMSATPRPSRRSKRPSCGPD